MEKLNSNPLEIDNKGCFFCNGMSRGGVSVRFLESFPELKPKDQVLFESANLFLIPDDAPLVQDHLLIVTKAHYLSFAEFDSKNINELESVKQLAAGVLTSSSEIASVLFFEHGSGRLSNSDKVIHCGACGNTSHAHLHIIPLTNTQDQTLTSILARIQIDLDKTALSIENKDLSKYQESPYLYLEENDTGFIFLPTEAFATVDIPSQYIRGLLGENFGIGLLNSRIENLLKNQRDLIKQRVRKTIGKFKN